MVKIFITFFRYLFLFKKFIINFKKFSHTFDWGGDSVENVNIYHIILFSGT